MEQPKKKYTIEICGELKAVLDKIRNEITSGSNGAIEAVSYYTASKILSMKINRIGIKRFPKFV